MKEYKDSIEASVFSWLMLQQVTTLGLTHFPIPQGKATKLATNDYIRDKLTTSGHGHVSVLGELLKDL